MPCNIAIHQPEFLPWLGFFQKMERCDCYVVFDHVQFKKRYVENRNRISGGAWLTVPVKSRGRYHQRINSVEIDNSNPWKRKFFGTLRHAYAKFPDFKTVEQDLRQRIMPVRLERLIDLNMILIDYFRERFCIETPMVYSSQLGLPHKKGSDLILEICRRLDAKGYICGASGPDYLNVSDFEKGKIEIIPQNFSIPSGIGIEQGPERYFSSLHHMIRLGLEKSKTLIKEICAWGF